MIKSILKEHEINTKYADDYQKVLNKQGWNTLQIFNLIENSIILKNFEAVEVVMRMYPNEYDYHTTHNNNYILYSK